MATTGSNANPFRYGGKFGYYTDTDTGLQLAGARWYSPNAFRWLSRDPIHYKPGDNLGGYVMGNPVKYADPSGLLVDAVFDTKSGALTIIDRDSGEKTSGI